MVTPYYFAYEDLLEDWQKVVDQADETSEKLPSKPSIVVKDFVEVMCLSQGLNAESLAMDPSLVNVSDGEGVNVLKQPAVIPPRREIGKFIVI
jgi:hypothetical protein